MQLEPLKVPLVADERGRLRVEGKRITLEQILHAYESGATAEEIVDMMPVLALAEVYAILSFYLVHRRDIEAYRASFAA